MREVELAEIASRAIQDKMQTEKHWRMVYLTHVFVNKMLRDKIDAEMEKFWVVEQAFKTIKTATVRIRLARACRMPRPSSASTSARSRSMANCWGRSQTMRGSSLTSRQREISSPMRPRPLRQKRKCSSPPKSRSKICTVCLF
jgi:hypothetical protein